MRSTTTSLVALVLVVAACGGESAAPETTTSTTAPTTTVTTAPATTTTTTTEPSTTTTSEPPAQIELPATWVGVTEDYEAVEVDTATGEILRSIAQVSTAEDVETAECSACVNAVDAVWRSFDGAHFYVSECCEPAAGMIHVLTGDDLPYLPGDDAPQWLFWSASPSPTSDEVAFLGYELVIAEPGLDPQSAQVGVDYTLVWTAEEALPISNAVWDGDVVHWLVGGTDGVLLHSYQVTDGTGSTVDVPDLDGWNSARLARRATGELVVARSPFDEPAAEALVFDLSGTVIDRFDIDPGSNLGGYDPSGAFLIYTDGEGVVRWRGGDGAGVLAEGFVQASW